MGTGNASLAAEIAEVQRFLKTTGLKCAMHSAGTTLGILKSIYVDKTITQSLTNDDHASE